MPIDVDLADLRVVGYEQKGLLSQLVTSLHELADQLAGVPAPVVTVMPPEYPTIEVPALDLTLFYELFIKHQNATSRTLEELKEIVKEAAEAKPAPAARILSGGGGPSTLKLERPNGTTNVWDVDGNLKVTTGLSGTWAYDAGADGIVTVPAGGRVIGVAAHAPGVAGSLVIDGGAPVPVPANTGIAIAPQATLVAPEITFTGTDSYFVEYVT